MRTKKAIFFLFAFLSYIPVLAQVDTAWVRRYNGPGNGDDVAYTLAVDDNGNVYVTGLSYNDSLNLDYATIKYVPNGDALWVRRYNGEGNGNDVAYAIAIDNSGNVYVTGSSGGDYGTIKYSSFGDTLWVRLYNGPGNGNDIAWALAVDDSGNVYVTGTSADSDNLFDYVTIKYNSSGDTLWLRRYDGLKDERDAYALKVDNFGNVYVTGTADYYCSWEGDPCYGDYATIKYAPNGDTLWIRRYNGLEGRVSFDVATALAVDDSGNVYVTGYSYGSGTSYDYATIKYTSSGDTLWVRRYNGPENYGDVAYALAADDSGNVYVAGFSGRDYATVKYSSTGDILWVRRYNGPGNSEDEAFALAVDDSGNVYVTGRSTGSGTIRDYATIKYVQFTCSARPGDANGDNKVLLSDIVTIINFLYRGAPAPNPSCRADANADGNVLLTDIVYLINFLFKSGPAPQKSRECCL